jgi:hypothetical protein
MNRILRVFLAVSLVALMAAPALANLAIDFSDGSANDFSNGSWSLGFKFTTNDAPVTVTQLGFYDDGKNGLTENHDVGIFDSAGNVLVSATVLTTDALTSWFRFHSITPYTLAANQTYFIQAVTGSEHYTYFPAGFSVDPAITFATDAWKNPQTNALAFPNSSYGFTQDQGSLFGPNFVMGAEVPVPPTILLLGSGLLGLGGWRRFRKG